MNPATNTTATTIQFGGSVAEATVEIRHQFIRKVYTILTVQLIATGAVSALSFLSDGYRNWIQSHPAMIWVSVRSVASPHMIPRFVPLLLYHGSIMFPHWQTTVTNQLFCPQFAGALVFMLLTFWKRQSYPTNLLFLSGFTLLEAYTISVCVSFFDSTTVLLAVVITAGIFVFLTAFACQTKYDFTSWIPYLGGALWGLIITGFIYAFLPHTSTSELVYGGVAALVFSGYILVDTQLVMRKYHVEEEIAAAISLYLDILNLFLAILRILNSQSDN